MLTRTLVLKNVHAVRQYTGLDLVLLVVCRPRRRVEYLTRTRARTHALHRHTTSTIT